MSEHILAVTDDSFDSDVLNSNIPVLVDFWAEWCGPCKMIAPILDEVASQFAGKVRFAKVNVDENKRTPVKYSVRGIPTLIIFKAGEVSATKVGAVDKSQLVAFVESALD